MDLILHNGNIVTVDERNSRAEAVAIKGNKIAAVGSNQEILTLEDEETKVVDLKGKTVVPGFNDSHMHLLWYALSLEEADLNACTGIDQLIGTVKDFIERENVPKGAWVQGRGWNETFFKEKRLPSRDDLDKISQKHPIVLTRTCGHLCVVNTKALKIAGIYENPPEIKKGSIDKDEKEIPTGILREDAESIIYNMIPKIGKDKIKKLILKAESDFLKAGLTSVQTDDFKAFNDGFKDVLDAYFELDNQKQLLIRVNEQMLLPTMEELKSFLKMGYKSGDGSEFFKIGPLKLLSDGSLGGRTAALSQAYEDDRDNKGILIYSQEELDNMVEMAYTNGLQVAIHAIGDRAMDMVIQSYKKVLKKHPKKEPRLRIIHAQVTTKSLINKFKEYNIIADIQPAFVCSDLSIAEARLGKKRAKWTYNWKTLLDKGIHVGAGSDCPTGSDCPESFNPLLGIYAAVTRKNLKGYPEEGWLPEQKITVEEALYIFTMGSAYSSFEEDIKGSITPGKLADIVVLSQDIFHIQPDSIKDVRVERTIVGGKILYEL